MAWDHSFDRAFKPRAVAFVGASRNPLPPPMRFFGVAGFMENFLRVGYQGSVYPINPEADEVLGQKCYPSLKALPEPVDLVLIGVPPRRVLSVLKECVETNNRNIHIFTAGFDETHTEAGRDLGRQVKAYIKEHRLLAIGPNCMGLSYVPRANMTVWDSVPMKAGPLGMVSQSGGHARGFIEACLSMGIGMSKVISIGNSFGLEPADFLEYFAHDPETEFVGLYLEQAGDGRHLLEAVQDLHWTKPIAIYKGGLTGPGARAAASHTGALAGEAHIWNAFFQQTKAIRCENVEELVDVLVALMCLHDIPGPRLCLVGGGGGNSVMSADLCAQAGLELPILTDKTQAELATYVADPGQSIRNPLDLMGPSRNPDQMARTVELVASDPLIDIVLMQGMSLVQPSRDGVEKAVSQGKRLAREKANGKPFALILDPRGFMRNTPGPEGHASGLIEGLAQEGIPVFLSLRRAAMALARAYRYHRDRQQAK